MSLNAVKVLGINITNNPENEILEFCQKWLFLSEKMGQKTPHNRLKTLTIVTPNPEQIVYAHHHPSFAEMLNRADISLPDGSGVVWARRVLYPKSTLHVIPGVNFMEKLVAGIAKKSVPMLLIGGQGALAVKAFDCLQKLHPGLTGWGMEAPSFVVAHEKLRLVNGELGIGKHEGKQNIHNSQFSIQYSNEEEYFDALAQKIIEGRIQAVFVGLGAPKQEHFIAALQKALGDTRDGIRDTKNQENTKLSHISRLTSRPVILMSVGGAFDEISGRLPRAPVWMASMGLKWLWRLLMEPWRVGRQLALGEFVWLVLFKRFFSVSK